MRTASRPGITRRLRHGGVAAVQFRLYTATGRARYVQAMEQTSTTSVLPRSRWMGWAGCITCPCAMRRPWLPARRVAAIGRGRAGFARLPRVVMPWTPKACGSTWYESQRGHVTINHQRVHPADVHYPTLRPVTLGAKPGAAAAGFTLHLRLPAYASSCLGAAERGCSLARRRGQRLRAHRPHPGTAVIASNWILTSRHAVQRFLEDDYGGSGALARKCWLLTRRTIPGWIWIRWSWPATRPHCA